MRPLHDHGAPLGLDDFQGLLVQPHAVLQVIALLYTSSVYVRQNAVAPVLGIPQNVQAMPPTPLKGTAIR